MDNLVTFCSKFHNEGKHIMYETWFFFYIKRTNAGVNSQKKLNLENKYMGKTTKVVGAVVSLICILVITLPLSITSTVMGAIHPGKCDLKDSMGINVAEWILGSGISGIIISVVGAILIASVVFMPPKDPFVVIILVTLWYIYAIAVLLFGLAWFIVGGVVFQRKYYLHT
jgi:hypothetical protein